MSFQFTCSAEDLRVWKIVCRFIFRASFFSEHINYLKLSVNSQKNVHKFGDFFFPQDFPLEITIFKFQDCSMTIQTLIKKKANLIGSYLFTPYTESFKGLILSFSTSDQLSGGAGQQPCPGAAAVTSGRLQLLLGVLVAGGTWVHSRSGQTHVGHLEVLLKNKRYATKSHGRDNKEQWKIHYKKGENIQW